MRSRDAPAAELGIIRFTRNADISHAAVEDVLRGQFRVHMNQHAVGSLSLAGMAGHCITVVEMWIFSWIECDRAVIVHVQIHSSVLSDVMIFPKSRLAVFSSWAGAVN
jgi:hypothetical protein